MQSAKPYFIVFCSLHKCTINSFTLSYKRQDFVKDLLSIKYMYRFPLPGSFEMLYILRRNRRNIFWNMHCFKIYNNHHHHYHLPIWIKSFDLFRHRRFTIVSWVSTISFSSGFLVEGVFRQSVVINFLKVVNPNLPLFGS